MKSKNSEFFMILMSEGFLLLKTKDGIEKIHFGDVSLG